MLGGEQRKVPDYILMSSWIPLYNPLRLPLTIESLTRKSLVFYPLILVHTLQSRNIFGVYTPRKRQ